MNKPDLAFAEERKRAVALPEPCSYCHAPTGQQCLNKISGTAIGARFRAFSPIETSRLEAGGDEPMILICPYCDTVSNHQTPVGEVSGEPENGDTSVCCKCGEVAVIDNTTPTGVRPPTDNEQAAISACPEVSEARAIIELR